MISLRIVLRTGNMSYVTGLLASPQFVSFIERDETVSAISVPVRVELCASFELFVIQENPFSLKHEISLSPSR